MKQLRLLAILLLVFQAHADTLLGKVINVADGDSITVLDATNTQHKVLLAGMDSNLVQVKRGLAWHYKKYEREQSSAD